MAETKAVVYPGSFDPITNGHVNLVERTLCIFDEVIIAIARNQDKGGALFSLEERIDMVRGVFGTERRVRVDTFEGLLVDYAERVGANAVLRGLRAVSDFEYEFQMATMNRRLKPNLETFFIMTGESSFYISSRLVKEVAGLGGDVTAFVPTLVLGKLQEKYGGH
jgi:pantetheine-phosphate adenylyltransferase